MRGDVGNEISTLERELVWCIQTQVAGECCRARNVVILSRYAGASRAERHIRGYVSNKETRAGHAFQVFTLILPCRGGLPLTPVGL